MEIRNRLMREAYADRDWERIAYHFEEAYPVNARDAYRSAEARFLREEAKREGIDLDALIEESRTW